MVGLDLCRVAIDKYLGANNEAGVSGCEERGSLGDFLGTAIRRRRKGLHTGQGSRKPLSGVTFGSRRWALDLLGLGP